MVNVLVDANVIIELAAKGEMWAFGSARDLTFHVTDSVEHEVQRPTQAEALAREVTRGSVRRLRLEELADLERYAILRDRLDEGECSCLVLAQSRGWRVATNERRRFMPIAKTTIGKERVMRADDVVSAATRKTAATKPRTRGSGHPA